MKTAALLIGKHHSEGLPGKNYRKLVGRPMVEYSLLAAAHCSVVERIFVSTDSNEIREIAAPYSAEMIPRPEHMARPESPTEYVFQHGYSWIRERYGALSYLWLLFANGPDTLPAYAEEAISILESNELLDSVISLSKFNMFSPLRARRLNSDGTSEPLLELSTLKVGDFSSRDGMGDVYFCDFGVQVVRPERCLLDVEHGAVPFKWLGHRQGSIIRQYGFDVDAEWQLPVMEKWLRDHGFENDRTPYDQAQAV